MQSYHHHHAPSSPIKGKDPTPTSYTTSSQPFPQPRRRPLPHSTFVRPHTALHTSRSYGTLEVPIERRSHTWTSSSGEPGLLSRDEDVDGREDFIDGYNQLATRYGIRALVPGDFPADDEKTSKPLPTRKGSWFSKKKLRRTSSSQSTQTVIIRSDQQQLQRRRSIGDVALGIVHHPKKDGLRNETPHGLVRLCGKSLLYLPPEYTPCSLVLPTCFRALAQVLVQQADTRGIFRVPGSVRIVDMLYNYYCADRDANNISTTTRCPSLPMHIKCNAHDVASAFKRLLAGLPGGILGSLSLFDALVAIHSQLHADPELTKTKETKLRARLIALAIGTVKSQYQRELICAVFGLLCFIGRAAETAPREDQNGRPLPTADLMGYNALSIVFGPLLVNDLINSYDMKVADPTAGLVLFPVSPPKSRKERHKHHHRHRRSKAATDNSTSGIAVDKIHIANSITEMLIVHWREVVRQMRSLGILRVGRHEGVVQHRANRDELASLTPDSFPSRQPQDLHEAGQSFQQNYRDDSSKTTIIPQIPKSNEVLKSPGATEDLLKPSSLKQRRSRQFDSSTPHGIQHDAPAEYNLSNSNEEAQKLEEPLSLDTHESHSTFHNRNTPSHVISSSEITFHSVGSTIPGSRNHGAHVLEAGEYITKTKELKLVSKQSSKQSIIPVTLPPECEVEDYLCIQQQDKSPADKWKALTLSSKASTESLAKAARERRLRRGSEHCSFRQKGESSAQRDRAQTTPEWKWHSINERNGDMLKPTRLSPERMSLFEKPPQSKRSKELGSPQKPKRLSPTRTPCSRISRPDSQRSSSRPPIGTVKAMTALFDHAAKYSPASPTPQPVGRTGDGSIEPSIILTPYSRSNSPSESIRSEQSIAASTLIEAPRSPGGEFQLVETPTHNREFVPLVSRSNLSAVSSRATLENTPPVSLRAKESTFYVSGKIPLTSSAAQAPLRDRELSQPPSLGTMIPYFEEPPVAQHINFARPPPCSSPRIRDESDNDDGDERLVTNSSRPGTSNSMLYSQIRHLQKHLEFRREENTQLRRQLEARENMDIGKLCEQLRIAKRECKVWHERAEAAERRVAVFKQFTTRIRGLRDAVNLEEIRQGQAEAGQVDGPSRYSARRRALDTSVSSSSTKCTEDHEKLNDCIRHNIRRRAVASSPGGTYCGCGENWERCSGTERKKYFSEDNDPESRTSQLWNIAEELLLLDGNRK